MVRLIKHIPFFAMQKLSFPCFARIFASMRRVKVYVAIVADGKALVKILVVDA